MVLLGVTFLPSRPVNVVRLGELVLLGGHDKLQDLKPGTESYGGQITQALQLIVATQEYQFA
jgi:hypothetical protein